MSGNKFNEVDWDVYMFLTFMAMAVIGYLVLMWREGRSNKRKNDSGYSDTMDDVAISKLLERSNSGKAPSSGDSVMAVASGQSERFQQAEDSVALLRKRNMQKGSAPSDSLDWSPSPIKPVSFVKRMVARWENSNVKTSTKDSIKQDDRYTEGIDTHIQGAKKVRFESDDRMMTSTAARLSGRASNPKSPWLSLAQDQFYEKKEEDHRE